MTGSARFVLLYSIVLTLGLALGAGPAGAALAFPLEVSADGRSLVGSDGRACLVQGDTPWSLIVQLDQTGAEQYLEDRRARGFNAILVNLLEHKFCDDPPNNAYGQGPFTTPGDFSTPNEAYFAHADWVIARAREKGIAVFLTPCYLGWNGGDEGFWAELNANSLEACREYGRYLGDRYAGFDNIVWVHGGDFNPPAGSAGELRALEILAGIEERDPAKLHTFHGGRNTTAADQAAFWPHMDLNAVYTGEISHPLCLQAYAEAEIHPHFLIEARYEGDAYGQRQVIRSQAYGSVLSGSSGHFYGHADIWPLGPGWVAALSAPGGQDMQRLSALFGATAWPALAPDVDRQLVTAGGGTFGQADFVVVSIGADSRSAYAYLPSTGSAPRSITLALARLAAPVEARWINPTDQSAVALAGSPFDNQGSLQVTTPGDNGTGAGDWVLALEAEAAADGGDADGGGEDGDVEDGGEEDGQSGDGDALADGDAGSQDAGGDGIEPPDADGGSPADDGGALADPGPGDGLPAGRLRGSCACAAGAPHAAGPWTLWLLAVLLTRRRRSGRCTRSTLSE